MGFQLVPEYNTRCPDCGHQLPEKLLEEHREECDGDAQAFDGECQLCGAEYDEYLTHLKKCEPRHSETV